MAIERSIHATIGAVPCLKSVDWKSTLNARALGLDRAAGGLVRRHRREAEKDQRQAQSRCALGPAPPAVPVSPG